MSNYKPKDSYFYKAKQDNYVARSIYKLKEIDERLHILSAKQVVVDFGCAPGSWLQYIADKVGKKGLVVGYDLDEVRVALPEWVQSFQENILDLNADRILNDLYKLKNTENNESTSKLESASEDDREKEPTPRRLKADLVVSDMSPKLTGIRDADQAKSLDLVQFALQLSDDLLKPGGSFVAKAFQGRGIDDLLDVAKQKYKSVKLLKPKATREGSREAFVIAEGKKIRS